MRRAVRHLLNRAAIAAAAALVLGALIVLPLTQASVRVITFMMLPVQPVVDRVFPSTYCYGRNIPREAFWDLAWRAALCALPAYLAILYVPAAARLIARSIHFAFRDRWRAAIYAVVGGLMGAYLGYFVWLKYGSAAAVSAYVLIGAATTAWVVTLSRAVIADGSPLRRSHS